MFRPNLTARLARRDLSKGCHLGFDPALMFQMPVLQAPHGLSLKQTEYMLRDRLIDPQSACNYPPPSKSVYKYQREKRVK